MVLFLVLTSPAAVFATSNDQNPNTQIFSSNTSTDNLSWVRFSLETNEPFHYSSTSNNYSLQMNEFVNGATDSCETSTCSYTWWLQSITVVSNSYSGNKGAYGREEVSESWHGTGGSLFCYHFPSSPPNVNNTNYDVLMQDTLNTTSDMTDHMSVAPSGGSDLYTVTQTCAYPSGHSSIDYFTQEEGVIGGGEGGGHASFTPLSSTIFYGYIDMVSNYNHMSSSSAQIQTGETSNLYQDVTQTVSEAYGSMYLYSVMSNENTHTDT